MATLSGGDALMKRLQEIAESMGGGNVQVGFMEGATYPDGTPVAAVAYWNEYGTTSTPSRPFFRNMIDKESSTWPGKMAALVKSTGGDGPQVLALMGEDIKDALQQSINEMQTPANAASTIEGKGFNKPLIDTGHMLNSVTYKVNT